MTTTDADAALVRVDAVLGHAGEDPWPDRLRHARVDVLVLDQAEAQKSRLRKTTVRGAEIAIALDRGLQLRDGDVLGWDEARRTAVVARVDLKVVLVIDLNDLLGEPQEEALARCVELGHALGNQHWAAVVKGGRVYVPQAVSRAVMASVMKTHAFADVTYSFAPGAEVLPCLTGREARRLFGGAGGHHHAGVRESPGQV